MEKKRWKLREITDPKSVLALADSLNISEILAALLLRRNVTNYYEAKTFFRPELTELHDPFLMDGMNVASSRVIQAITGGETICVYGDYDVDGTCAAALMFLFLKELGADVFTYIPNRINDGYGLSVHGIDKVKEKNASLIISVDCGITAINEINYANTLRIDTIVCDHHKPKDEIPNAVAVLDPLKPGDKYPFKYLSGAGVAFKLARAVADRIGKIDMPLKYLDLVALAGAADIVPLIDENRVLVMKGIEQINSNPRPGIKALIEVARMKPGNLSAGQIVFTIAPRINAVGRMGDAIRAVDLFITDNVDDAKAAAEVLELENFQRRKIDESTFTHAQQLVLDTIDLENDSSIILHGSDWHPGVIGIVASRMVEKYYRPSVMLTTIDGVAKGSARSVSGFNIYKALEQCDDLLLQFGGHEAAAGLEIEIDKIPEFKLRFNEAVKNLAHEDDLIPEVVIDFKISLNSITPSFVRVLEQFAPFGPGNLRPVFLAEDVEVAFNPRIVGHNHLIACFKQNGNDKIFDAIGFNLGSYVNLLDKDKTTADIVFTIEKLVREDGKSYPQLRIKDIKVNKKESVLGVS